MAGLPHRADIRTTGPRGSSGGRTHHLPPWFHRGRLRPGRPTVMGWHFPPAPIGRRDGGTHLPTTGLAGAFLRPHPGRRMVERPWGPAFPALPRGKRPLLSRAGYTGTRLGAPAWIETLPGPQIFSATGPSMTSGANALRIGFTTPTGGTNAPDPRISPQGTGPGPPTWRWRRTFRVPTGDLTGPSPASTGGAAHLAVPFAASLSAERSSPLEFHHCPMSPMTAGGERRHCPPPGGDPMELRLQDQKLTPGTPALLRGTTPAPSRRISHLPAGRGFFPTAAASLATNRSMFSGHPLTVRSGRAGFSSALASTRDPGFGRLPHRSGNGPPSCLATIRPFRGNGPIGGPPAFRPSFPTLPAVPGRGVGGRPRREGGHRLSGAPTGSSCSQGAGPFTVHP